MNDDLSDDELKNIIAFLCIFLGEHACSINNFSPEYIKEKYLRYIKYPAVSNEYKRGMHSILNVVFDEYCKKWFANESITNQKL